MVARVGGYCWSAFQGFRGVTQGFPLSPTIFIVVVDALSRHWVEVMSEGAGEQGVHGQEGRHQNALLYSDDGMVELSDPGWIQGAFRNLVWLFERVGLNTNVGKTVRMVCRPCQATGTQSEAAYNQRLMGAGTSYQERQRVWVHCTECGEETALEFPEVHLQTQHRKATIGRHH